jgi:hypothetical protein
VRAAKPADDFDHVLLRLPSLSDDRSIDLTPTKVRDDLALEAAVAPHR